MPTGDNKQGGVEWVLPNAEWIEAVAQRTAEILINGQKYIASNFTPILTRREAMRYVRRNSTQAFSEWAARWGCRAEMRGRWSKTRLDLALAREAGTARMPAGMRK